MKNQNKIKLTVDILLAVIYSLLWYHSYEWVVILLLTMQINSAQEYLRKIYDK